MLSTKKCSLIMSALRYMPNIKKNVFYYKSYIQLHQRWQRQQASNVRNYSNLKCFVSNWQCVPQTQNSIQLFRVDPAKVKYGIIYSFSTKSSPDRAGKSDSKSAAIAETDIFGEASKLGLFAKFKLMYKKYWYVLIPVHVVTSVFWFGGFYYMSKSGVNLPALMEYINISESIIQRVQASDMGHIAIAYLCYKVATPLRYAVTLGGTTVSIKYLVQAGHIKPMPSKKELMQMYEQKKADRTSIKSDKTDSQSDNSGKEDRN